MVYRNSDPLQKAKFLARAQYLAEKGKDADLTELRPSARRNASQNACFHAWCALIAETIGEHDLESVKRDVKRRILGLKKVRNVFTGKETFEDYQTHIKQKCFLVSKNITSKLITLKMLTAILL